jgi:prepilin-type N-terminal cleavage/methylation domain-containing protein
MMQAHPRTRGQTLVELLFALVILAAFAVAVWGLLRVFGIRPAIALRVGQASFLAPLMLFTVSSAALQLRQKLKNR